MNKNNRLSFSLIVVSLIGIYFSMSYAINLTQVFAIDWWIVFQPATVEAMKGGDPYNVTGFFNPPWVLLAFAPLANLPLAVAFPILFIINTIGYTWTAYKMKVNKFLIVPFFIFSGAILSAALGNIDGVLLFGLFLPPWMGIVILMIKPQIGIPVLLFHILVILFSQERLHTKAIQLFKFMFPLFVLTLLSILIYGDWFSNSSKVVSASWNKAIFWPYGIPFGILLIWIGVIKKNVKIALIAIPFMTPYISNLTVAISILGFLALYPERFLGHVLLRSWTRFQNRAQLPLIIEK